LSKNIETEILEKKILEETEEEFKKNSDQISMFDDFNFSEEKTEEKTIFEKIKILKISKITKKILKESEKISNLE